jgi:hypothetical protein
MLTASLNKEAWMKMKDESNSVQQLRARVEASP